MLNGLLSTYLTSCNSKASNPSLASFFFFNSSNIVLSMAFYTQTSFPSTWSLHIHFSPLPGIPFAASAQYNQPYPSLKTKCKICPIFGKKSLTFQARLGGFSELSQSLKPPLPWSLPCSKLSWRSLCSAETALCPDLGFAFTGVYMYNNLSSWYLGFVHLSLYVSYSSIQSK